MEGLEALPAALEASLGSQPLLATGRGKQDVYQRGSRIGKGAFGDVFVVHQRGAPLDRRRAFVLKVIKLARQTEWQRQATYREIKLMAALRHPFIVPFIDQWLDNSHTVNVVLGYCEQGDLAVLLNKRQGKLFDEATLKSWLAQLLLALHYLEQQAVLHRDIKTGNIFLHADGYVQLGDFGLASVRDSEDAGSQHDQSLVGTPHFMSPELLSQKGYSHQTDIWSLGCVMYELSAQKPAFTAFNLNGLVEKIRNRGTAPLPASYSQEWNSLIKSMLRKNPEKRPSVLELMSAPCMVSAVADARRLARSLLPDVDLPPLSLPVPTSLSLQASLDTAVTPTLMPALGTLSSQASADADATDLLMVQTSAALPAESSTDMEATQVPEATVVQSAAFNTPGPHVAEDRAYVADCSTAQGGVTSAAGQSGVAVSSRQHRQDEQQQQLDAAYGTHTVKASVVGNTSAHDCVNGGHLSQHDDSSTPRTSEQCKHQDEQLEGDALQPAVVTGASQHTNAGGSGQQQAKLKKCGTTQQTRAASANAGRAAHTGGKAGNANTPRAAAGASQLHQRLLKPGTVQAHSGADDKPAPALGPRGSMPTGAEATGAPGGRHVAAQGLNGTARCTPRTAGRVQRSKPGAENAAEPAAKAEGAVSASTGSAKDTGAGTGASSRQTTARRPWTAGTATANTADGSNSNRCRTGGAAAAATSCNTGNNGSSSARAARMYAHTAFVFRAPQRVLSAQPAEKPAKNGPAAALSKLPEVHELLDQAQQASNADAVAVVEGIMDHTKAAASDSNTSNPVAAKQMQVQVAVQQGGATTGRAASVLHNRAQPLPAAPSSPSNPKLARTARAAPTSRSATVTGSRTGTESAKKQWVGGARNGVSSTQAATVAPISKRPRVCRYDPNDADIEDTGVRTSHGGVRTALPYRLPTRRHTGASSDGLSAAVTPDAASVASREDAKAAAELACITKAPSTTAPSSGCSTRRVSSEGGLPPWRPAGAAATAAAKPGSPKSSKPDSPKAGKPDSPKQAGANVIDLPTAAASTDVVDGAACVAAAMAAHGEAASECSAGGDTLQNSSVTSSLRQARQALAMRSSSSKTRQAALLANLTKAMGAPKPAPASTGATGMAAANTAEAQHAASPAPEAAAAASRSGPQPMEVDSDAQPLWVMQPTPGQGRQRRKSGLPQPASPASPVQVSKSERSSDDGERRSSLSGPLGSPLSSYTQIAADNAVGELSPIMAHGTSEYPHHQTSTDRKYPALRMFDNATVLADNPAADLSPMHTDGGDGEGSNFNGTGLILATPVDGSSTRSPPAGLGMYYNAMFGMGRRTTDSSHTAAGESGQGSQRHSQTGASGIPARSSRSQVQGVSASSGGGVKRRTSGTGTSSRGASSGGSNPPPSSAPHAPPSMLPAAPSQRGSELPTGRATSPSQIPLAGSMSVSSASARSLVSEPSSEVDLAGEHAALSAQGVQQQAQVTPRLYGSAPAQQSATAAALLGGAMTGDEGENKAVMPGSTEQRHSSFMVPATLMHGSAGGAPPAADMTVHVSSQQPKQGVVPASSPASVRNQQLPKPAADTSPRVSGHGNVVNGAPQEHEVQQLRQVVLDAHSLFEAGHLAELGRLLAAAATRCSLPV